jgi:hypothetical protein
MVYGTFSEMWAQHRKSSSHLGVLAGKELVQGRSWDLRGSQASPLPVNLSALADILPIRGSD